jgi:hypothetical protein
MKQPRFLLTIATALIAAGALALTAPSASAQNISDRAQAPTTSPE